MSKFAKIFEMEDGNQVLFRVQTGEESSNGEPVTNLVTTTDLLGLQVSATVSYDDKETETIEAKFQAFGIEDAINFYSGMKEFLQQYA